MPKPLRVTAAQARRLAANVERAVADPPAPSLRDQLRALVAASPALAGITPGAVEAYRGQPSVVCIWAAPQPHPSVAAAQAARALAFQQLATAATAQGWRTHVGPAWVRVIGGTP